jgi:DNA-binding Lrp family transcriptional regulator
MLDRLLELLQEGGTRRVHYLADELDTTPMLVQVMLEDLARMGYLRRVGAECSGECTACPLSGTCVAEDSSCERSKRRGSMAWVLAEKEREE